MTFALSHRGTLYLSRYTSANNYSPNRIAQSCSATWFRLLWSGHGTCVHRRVKHERNDYFNYPNERPRAYRVRRPFQLSHRHHLAGDLKRAPKFYPRYVLRSPERRLSQVSEPFPDEHDDESFRPTCREFNFAGESPWRKWRRERNG